MARTSHLGMIGLSSDEKAELLIEFLETDQVSWFNAITDAMEDGSLVNSHAAMERLAAGLAAIQVAGGFPGPIFHRMVGSSMQQAYDHATR